MALRRLYLDQKDWIALAKLGVAKSDVESLRPGATALVERIAKREISVPLSQSHILETWNIGQADQRWEVAKTMLMLSRRAAIAPIQTLWTQEFDYFLHRQFGSVPAAPPEPFSKGLNFALGFTDDDVQPLWPATSDVDIVVLETFVLAEPGRMGLSSAEIARRRSWASWAESLSMGAQQLVVGREKYNERDRLAAVTLSMLRNEWIGRAIGRDAHEQLLAFLASEGAWAVVEQLPSLATLTELHRLHYPNVSRRWVAQDYHDLQFLSVALAYCEGVCLDRFWADVVGRSEFLSNRGVKVAAGNDALERMVKAL